MATTYDMDKRVTCTTCRGEGTIDEPLGGEPYSNRYAKCPDCIGRGQTFATSNNKVQRVGPVEVLREELDVYTTWSARIVEDKHSYYTWVLSHNRRDGYLFAGYRDRNMTNGNMPVAPAEADTVAMALLTLNADDLVERLR
jgi:hypothetical protein